MSSILVELIIDDEDISQKEQLENITNIIEKMNTKIKVAHIHLTNTKPKIDKGHLQESCGFCKKLSNKPDSYSGWSIDSCMGYLPGVISACCGHGKHKGHILFANRTRIEFETKDIKIFKQTQNKE